MGPLIENAYSLFQPRLRLCMTLRCTLRRCGRKHHSTLNRHMADITLKLTLTVARLPLTLTLNLLLMLWRMQFFLDNHLPGTLWGMDQLFSSFLKKGPYHYLIGVNFSCIDTLCILEQCLLLFKLIDSCNKHRALYYLF